MSSWPTVVVCKYQQRLVPQFLCNLIIRPRMLPGAMDDKHQSPEERSRDKQKVALLSVSVSRSKQTAAAAELYFLHVFILTWIVFFSGAEEWNRARLYKKRNLKMHQSICLSVCWLKNYWLYMRNGQSCQRRAEKVLLDSKVTSYVWQYRKQRLWSWTGWEL